MGDSFPTLRSFYDSHYLPTCVENPATRNVEGYNRAVDLWERLTDDPPLERITAATLSTFKSGLLALEFRGRPLSPNTVRKHLSHVQWILDAAGPPGPRNRTAAGVLDRVPFTKPPKLRRTYRDPVSADDLVSFWHALEGARLPRIDGVEPANVWRALVAVIASTTIRVGQLNATPTDAFDLAGRRLILPADVCTKSKTEEIKPLHAVAVARLVAIRTDRPRLFPLWSATPATRRTGRRERAVAPHSKTAIYNELRRLQKSAGVAPFGFHSMRRFAITALSAVSPAAAQLAAGHSSYQTTQLYQGLELLDDAVSTLSIFDHLQPDADRNRDERA